MPSTRTRSHHCNHAACVEQGESAVITELTAVMAHLEAALAADPAASTAFYRPHGLEHLVAGWIRGNADTINRQLHDLLARYPAPGDSHPTATHHSPSSNTEPARHAAAHDHDHDRACDEQLGLDHPIPYPEATR